ncbi:MAG: DUF4199 domain-containing protein [Prevotella sp.]|nr:DUF4199 domain-containing protein [Bacteroidales bacterium]MDY4956753.1 DUF4199 domain-containing protein [Prevotella sp.]
MMNIPALIQLKAFARQDGAILTAVWTVSFLSFMYAPGSGIGNLMALLTPAVIVWRMVKFRNYALDGVMSYRRALAYTLYVFFYASVAFALMQFLFLKFIDQGQMNLFLQQSFNAAAPIWEQQGFSRDEIREYSGMILDFSPLNKTFVFMMENMFVGFLSSFIIALTGVRKPPLGRTPNQ